MARLVVEQAGRIDARRGSRAAGFRAPRRRGRVRSTAARSTLANRLVGNPDGAAVLEVLVGGFRARFEGDGRGSRSPAHGAGRPSTADALRRTRRLVPATVPCSSSASPSAASATCWPCAAASTSRPDLGSRSRDTLAGLGPEPVAPGRCSRSAPSPRHPCPLIDQDVAFPPPDGAVTLALLPGPRADWFTDVARRALFDGAWRLSEQADRIGVRLIGRRARASRRRRARERGDRAGLDPGRGRRPADDPARRPAGHRRVPGHRDRRAGVTRRGGAAATRSRGALPARVSDPSRARRPSARETTLHRLRIAWKYLPVPTSEDRRCPSTTRHARRPARERPRSARLPHPGRGRRRGIRLHRHRRHPLAVDRLTPSRRRRSAPHSPRASASCARCGSRRS